MASKTNKKAEQKQKMVRVIAIVACCALLLTALALPKKPAQPVFFSMLFEQLLPEWFLGEATEDEAGEAARTWL